MQNLKIHYQEGNLPKDESERLFSILLKYGEKHNLDISQASYAFVLKDETGKVYGGLTCDHIYDEFKIKLLAMDESLRGQGYGSKLMAEAEKLAKKLGFKRVLVTTFEFQAPKFYQKLGYKIEFVRESENPLLKRYHLIKKI